MVKIDEEGVVCAELFLILIGDPRRTVAKSVDVRFVPHAFGPGGLEHHAAGLKGRPLGKPVTRADSAGTAGGTQPELLPKTAALAFHARRFLLRIERAIFNYGHHGAVQLHDEHLGSFPGCGPSARGCGRAASSTR
jgi:hypothetical protein